MNLIENTSFLTRKEFEMKVTEKLSQELNKEQTESFEFRNKFKSYLLLIDLDRFQAIKCAYGHNKGDEILKKYFSIIDNFFSSEFFKDKVYLCRYSDGTVGIFIYDISFYNLKSFENLKDKINDSLVDLNTKIYEELKPIEFKSIPALTCSIGLTVIDNIKTNKKYQDIIRITDEALYTAKELFRDRLEFRNYPI